MTGNNIPIGPYHPLLEEAEYFNLIVDGETVVDIDMDIGWMHRGHEFISEQKIGRASCRERVYCEV